MAVNLILGTFLGICSYTDIKKKEVYTMLMAPFLLAGIAVSISPLGPGIKNALFGVAVGVFILILSFITRGSIGAGDGIALMITGFYLGFLDNIRLLCLALFLSAIISVAVLLIKRCGKDKELPFMPFLLIAFLIIRFCPDF